MSRMQSTITWHKKTQENITYEDDQLSMEKIINKWKPWDEAEQNEKPTVLLRSLREERRMQGKPLFPRLESQTGGYGKLRFNEAETQEGNYHIS